MLFHCREFKKEALQSIKENRDIVVRVFLAAFLAELLLVGLFLASSLIGSYILTTIIYLILLSANLSVIPFTLMRFCLILSKGQTSISFQDFSLGFQQTLPSILCMLWSNFWIFLWGLLFVIPGYVKYFAYSQAFFILADNPSIGVCDSVTMSKEITYGNKGKLLLLELSFLGWGFLVILVWTLALSVDINIVLTILLDILTWGLTFGFLIPYYLTAKSKAYLFLRQEAIRKGNFTPADFGLVDETVIGDTPNL